MNPPAKLAAKLARQWQNAHIREQRLLTSAAWPICLSIGRPSAEAVEHQLDAVRAHLQRWRQVTVGEVQWQSLNYRGTSEAVAVPITWVLHKPSEWITACGSMEIKQEFQRLERLIRAAEPVFHSLLIRQRHLLSNKTEEEIVQALHLVQLLQPGCAQGAPLRALAIGGVDSKFYERNRQLIIKLLDIRHTGFASELGLEAFLNAADERDHWLLTVDLTGGLLPYRQMRVRDCDLQHTALPANNILIIENERCTHLLPNRSDSSTIAILGAGLNLSWMTAEWLQHKHIAYWGDIDAWGLTMLARARTHQPHISPLLMSRDLYDSHAEKAVNEPSPSCTLPAPLTKQEEQLFEHLLTQEKGRLEQEYLPMPVVFDAIKQWLNKAEHLQP